MISAAVARIEYFFSGFVFSFLKDFITFADVFRIKGKTSAEVAQLVEHQPSKLNVASSNLVFRSNDYRKPPEYISGGFFHIPAPQQPAHRTQTQQKTNPMSRTTPSPVAPSLLAWYARHARALPWRETNDPYRIWISEIILQQTRIAQGTAYYLRFTERFADVVSLAQAPLDEVMKHWQGLGYYTRARNLHAAAKIISERHEGSFPRRYPDVRALPGVGDYTAAAICSIAYRLPVAAVDGNVYRVLSRYFDLDTPVDTTEGKRLFARLAEEQLDRNQPGQYNQALMDFGALQCVPGQPDCTECPLRTECQAFANGTVLSRPVKSKRPKLKTRYLHYFCIENGEKIAVRQRTGKDIWQGLYEFPGFETRQEIPPEAILHEERFTRLVRAPGKVELREISAPVRHILSHQQLYIRFYRLQLHEEHPTDQTPTNTGYAYLTAKELSALAFPRPIAAYLESIELF